jgi:hypothetical protein
MEGDNVSISFMGDGVSLLPITALPKFAGWERLSANRHLVRTYGQGVNEVAAIICPGALGYVFHIARNGFVAPRPVSSFYPDEKSAIAAVEAFIRERGLMP